MKVGFLFLHPFSESLGSTTRVLEIAKALSEKNFEPVIFNPYEPSRIIDNIKVVNVKLPTYIRLFKNKLYRILRLVYYSKYMRRITTQNIFKENKFFKALAKALRKAMMEEKIDVLIIEQDFALIPGIKASSEIGIPTIADLHNITAEELVAAGILNYSDLEFRTMQEKLKDLLREVDGVVVVSDALAEYVKENYEVESQKIILVPPGGRPRIEEIPNREKP